MRAVAARGTWGYTRGAGQNLHGDAPVRPGSPPSSSTRPKPGSRHQYVATAQAVLAEAPGTRPRLRGCGEQAAERWGPSTGTSLSVGRVARRWRA